MIIFIVHKKFIIGNLSKIMEKFGKLPEQGSTVQRNATIEHGTLRQSRIDISVLKYAKFLPVH